MRLLDISEIPVPEHLSRHGLTVQFDLNKISDKTLYDFANTVVQWIYVDIINKFIALCKEELTDTSVDLVEQFSWKIMILQ